MDDELKERTRRLLTDYILFCARAPDSPEPLPTSVEAALLRSLTSQIQQENQALFDSFRDYQGNRLELVRQMADELLSNDQEFNWGRLVMLLAFVGSLMNQDRTIKQRTDQWNRLLLDRDCCLIVSLLYSRLTGRHGSWLETHGGWDGFCQFFKNPLPLGFWRKLLIRAIVSCFFATAIFYIWKCL